jgi:hypothetical protein
MSVQGRENKQEGSRSLHVSDLTSHPKAGYFVYLLVVSNCATIVVYNRKKSQIFRKQLTSIDTETEMLLQLPHTEKYFRGKNI